MNSVAVAGKSHIDICQTCSADTCSLAPPPGSSSPATTREVIRSKSSPAAPGRPPVTVDHQQQQQQPSATTTSSKLLGRVYLPADCIDPEALKQLHSMCHHPAVTNVRVMPDVHKGNGCCIGFTSKLRSCISPQLIGGDIGCGITSHPIPAALVERKNGLERILNIIHQNVPMGTGGVGLHEQPIIRVEQFQPFLEDATKDWHAFVAAYSREFGVNLDQAVMARYAPYCEHAAVPPQQQSSSASCSPLSSPTKKKEQQQQRTGGTGDAAVAPAAGSAATATTSTAPPLSSRGKGGAHFVYTQQWLNRRLSEWQITLDDVKVSLGTLGSGNHFIELNERTTKLDDHSNNISTEATTTTTTTTTPTSTTSPTSPSSTEEDQQRQEGGEKDDDDTAEAEEELPEYILSVHTGSRAVGQAVYRYWTKRCSQLQQARALLSGAGGTPSKNMQQHQQGGTGKPAPPSSPEERASDDAAASASSKPANNATADDEELVPFDAGFLLTTPEDVGCYYMDMIFAQQFALMNRRAILSCILYALGDRFVKFSEKSLIESVHNYIDFRDFVVRKGAIRADRGQRVLIGLNMKEGLWLCRGKGNAEWNNSAAHGCGRVVSRRAAAAMTSSALKKSGKGSNKSGGRNKNFEDPKLKQFKQEMGDIVTNSVTAETYDERPSVYRNSSLVRSLLDPAVDILRRYRTVLNAKGGHITI